MIRRRQTLLLVWERRGAHNWSSSNVVCHSTITRGEREKEKALENSKGGATFVRATNFDVRVSFAMHTGSLCRSYVVAFCHSDHQTTSVVPRYSKGKLFLHNSEDKTNESNI